MIEDLLVEYYNSLLREKNRSLKEKDREILELKAYIEKLEDRLKVKPPPSGIRTSLDRLSKEWCRSIGYCEARPFYGGECSEMLTVHHVSKRKNYANRWLPDNLKCVCDNHHKLIESDIAQEKQWIESLWPGLFQRLKDRELTIRKIDYVLLEEQWRKLARIRRLK